MTSGATGDIKSATNLARRMVCEFGMSEKLGLIEYGEHQGEVYIARDLGDAFPQLFRIHGGAD